MIGIIIVFCIAMFILTFQRSKRKQQEAYKNATEGIERIISSSQKYSVATVKSDMPNIIKIGGNKVRVKRSYLDRFIRGAIINEELFWAEEDAAGYVTTTVEELERMESKLAEYKARNRRIK